MKRLMLHLHISAEELLGAAFAPQCLILQPTIFGQQWTVADLFNVNINVKKRFI